MGAVIIAAVFSGFFAAFIGVRTYTNRSRDRLDAANLARTYSAQLSNHIFAGTGGWDDAGNPLSPGTNKTLSPVPPAPRFSGDYDVVDRDIDGDTIEDYRIATIRITYPDS